MAYLLNNNKVMLTDIRNLCISDLYRDKSKLLIYIVTTSGGEEEIVINKPNYLRLMLDSSILNNIKVAGKLVCYEDVLNCNANKIYVQGNTPSGLAVINKNINVTHGIKNMRAKILKVSGNLYNVEVQVSDITTEVVVREIIRQADVIGTAFIKGNLYNATASDGILATMNGKPLKNKQGILKISEQMFYEQEELFQGGGVW